MADQKDAEMAQQAQIETTDGVLILPRFVSWTVAVSVIAALAYFVSTATGVMNRQDVQASEIGSLDRRVTTLESDRNTDRQAITKVQTQMDFAIEILKRLDDRMVPK